MERRAVGVGMRGEMEGEGEEEDEGNRTLRNGGAAALGTVRGDRPRGHQTPVSHGEVRTYLLRGQGQGPR